MRIDSVWCSVKETNWRAELETFGKGVANDSQEAQEIVHRGLESLESIPRQATAHLPAGLGVGLEGFGEQMSGGVDPTLAQQRINKVCNYFVILAFLSPIARRMVLEQFRVAMGDCTLHLPCCCLSVLVQ